jgi:hypothetical protein
MTTEFIKAIEIKKGRGGARVGAGRKKVTAKRYWYNAPQDVADILEAQSNRSEYITMAIRFYDKNK